MTPVLPAACAVAALIAIGLLFALARRVHRDVISSMGELEPADVDEAAAAVFREADDVAEIVAAASELFRDSERWIHRRVEHIEFTGTETVRRRVSIDFSVPDSAILVSQETLEAAWSALPTEAIAAGGSSLAPFAHQEEAEPSRVFGPSSGSGDQPRRYRLVPISLLRGWPPVMNFDLRNSTGGALSLLTKGTSSYLDLALLRTLARTALGDQAASALDYALTNVTHSEGQRSSEGAQHVREAVEQWTSKHGGEVRSEWGARQLVDMCRSLSTATFLWVVVDGEPGERVLVKLAYDEPLKRRLVWWRRPLTALGWATEVTHVQVPHIGTAGSYHLQVQVPAPAEVVRARLRTADDPRPSRASPSSVARRWLAQRYAAITKTQPPLPPPVDTRQLERVLTHHAHMYRGPGERSGVAALAEIKLTIGRRGQPTAGLVISLLVAAALTGLGPVVDDVFSLVHAGDRGGSDLPSAFGPTIGFLLLAPGLLAYVVNRTEEHAIVRRMISGTRTITVLTLLLPVVAAALLLAAGTHGRPGFASDATYWLTRAAWLLAAVQTVGWLMPVRRTRHRAD